MHKQECEVEEHKYYEEGKTDILFIHMKHKHIQVTILEAIKYRIDSCHYNLIITSHFNAKIFHAEKTEDLSLLSQITNIPWAAADTDETKDTKLTSTTTLWI